MSSEGFTVSWTDGSEGDSLLRELEEFTFKDDDVMAFKYLKAGNMDAGDPVAGSE